MLCEMWRASGVSLVTHVHRCDHCARVTGLSEAGARSIGWRFYCGKSMTGKELAATVCPVCSDRGPDPGPPTWDIRCLFCEWRYTDAWDIDSVPVLTAWEAWSLIQRHEGQCAPEMTRYEVLDPDTMTWQLADEPEFQKRVAASTPGSKKNRAVS